jgi:purine catabolism regulator
MLPSIEPMPAARPLWEDRMISVDGLVSTTSLGLDYLGGRAGGSRPVTWAHVCDLPDPWHWCKPGDIVMTTGAGLPDDGDTQAEWLKQLIESSVSALVVAPRPGSPDVTPELIALADVSAFPVLSADFSLEFVTLARVVIESSIRVERERLESTRRVYDFYLNALRARAGLSERLRVVGAALGCRLELAADLPTESPEPTIVLEVPARRPTWLVATPASRASTPDAGLLQHVVGIIALELEWRALTRDSHREAASKVLGSLIDGQAGLATIFPNLHDRGLVGPVVLACWMSPDGVTVDHTDLHHHPSLDSVHPYLMQLGGDLIGIVPNDPDLLVALADELSESCVVGISAPLAPAVSVIDAVRQARLAARWATESRDRYRSYAEARTDSGLLPRSLGEAEDIVRRVLGQLLDYDAGHAADLAATLRTFLHNDGTWQKTASDLNIHRQTLVYRLRKIEALTGLKPTSTVGTATLWQALALADLLDP